MTDILKQSILEWHNIIILSDKVDKLNSAEWHLTKNNIRESQQSLKNVLYLGWGNNIKAMVMKWGIYIHL